MTVFSGIEGEVRFIDTMLRGKHGDGDHAWIREFEKAQYAEWKCDCWENGNRDPAGNTSGEDAPTQQLQGTRDGVVREAESNVLRGASAAKIVMDVPLGTLAPTGVSSRALMPGVVTALLTNPYVPAEGAAEKASATTLEKGSSAPGYQWNKSFLHAAQTGVGIHVYLRDAELDAVQDGEAILQRLRRELRHSGQAVAALTVNGKTFE